MAPRLKALSRSSKGFYLVSPFLGFFFFLIAVSMTMVVVSENNQQTSIARASETHRLVFDMYAIQADAFDVYFQNFLQKELDNYTVGDPNELAIRTELEEKTKSAMAGELGETYKRIYNQTFSITCNTSRAAWSLVILKFNTKGSQVLKDTINTFTTYKKTAMWPYVSQYYLACGVSEPPIDVSTSFRSRWYYLDADCICCQGCIGAAACHLVNPPSTTKNCPHCSYQQDCASQTFI